MVKVFVVTQGSYSDYHIEAIFSTKELAEESGQGDINEWELDPPKGGWIIGIIVRMQKDGNVSEFWEERSDTDSNNPYVGFHRYDVDGNLVWSVKTDDKERAIKVVNEKRIQILAMDIWGDTQKTQQSIW